MFILMLGMLACNLVSPEGISTPDSSSIIASTPLVNPPATESEIVPPTEGVPNEETLPGVDIQPAAAAAILNCNALDVTRFSAIVNDTFIFVTQDQLNNCIYTTSAGYNLIIGGGKPASLDEVKSQFDTVFGALPDSTWEAIDNYYLGMAFSSVTVTAQGISAGRHTMVIVAGGNPDTDLATLQPILAELAREVAR